MLLIIYTEVRPPELHLTTLLSTLDNLVKVKDPMGMG